MRVIAGQFRSRKLKTVSGLLVRPTSDRLRETLFNILSPRLHGKVFLDAYAGTGAVGIEALSRGASRIILIERHPEAFAIIHQNLSSLGISEGALVIKGSAGKVLPKQMCDIAFVDPPYDQPNEYDQAMAALDDMECPLVIAQHESRKTLADTYGKLKKFRLLKQGENSLSFFELTGAA